MWIIFFYGEIAILSWSNKVFSLYFRVSSCGISTFLVKFGREFLFLNIYSENFFYGEINFLSSSKFKLILVISSNQGVLIIFLPHSSEFLVYKSQFFVVGNFVKFSFLNLKLFLKRRSIL